MKRLCIISLFILLAGCAPAQSTAQEATPTTQSVYQLGIPDACQSMEDGLCVMSPAGETLGGGKTTVIKQAPVAHFLNQTTAVQIKVGDWTLVFDPGGNIPFSVGMTFPNAKLYPQEKGVGLDIQNGGTKCTQLNGEFMDFIMQSAQNGIQEVNPISSFDIVFMASCNGESQSLQGRVKMSQK